MNNTTFAYEKLLHIRGDGQIQPPHQRFTTRRTVIKLFHHIYFIGVHYTELTHPVYQSENLGDKVSISAPWVMNQ